jgi:hypothetical protein
MNLSKKITLAFITTILGVCSQTTSAASRVTSCQVENYDKTIFDGTCVVHEKGERSFYLTNKDPKKTLFAKVLALNFAVGEGAITNETIVTTTLSNGGMTDWGPVMGTTPRPNKKCWTATAKYIIICIGK